MSPIIATSWVITLVLFGICVFIISLMVYIFKAVATRWNLGPVARIFLLLVMLFFLLIPIRICQIAFDAVAN